VALTRWSFCTRHDATAPRRKAEDCGDTVAPSPAVKGRSLASPAPVSRRAFWLVSNRQASGWTMGRSQATTERATNCHSNAPSTGRGTFLPDVDLTDVLTLRVGQRRGYRPPSDVSIRQ